MAKEPARPIKRRKPRAQRKTDSIRVRVTESQKATLEEAAEASGLGLSGWILSVALEKAAAQKAARSGA
jgi:uncharacterized protein (DUF1778 family)